ncbi:nitrate ABC transporter substrate-binding protein [Erwinia sp. CGal63]|uniref:nitrate ABC transporter substrate-binding protein n=1 Tax=Erwinia sp. CGal63 TaxID=2919889 RepID=UPI00300B7665
MVTIRLAVRDWDYFTPLALGDIRPEGFALEVHRVGTLVNDLANSETYDAAEISFSRYAQLRARGDSSLWALPHFLMRGFRQRCIITTENSSLISLDQLKGKRIGVTGWQDSGNSWTRALLREAGVEIEDVYWYAGRLTADHPIVDRLGSFGRPGHIEAAPGEHPLIDLLKVGELDAIFTPFMPQGFFNGSGLRQLQRDFREAELAWFNRVGYIPGHHILAFKPDIARRYPDVAAELSELIDRSARLWHEKREKYADTTPWLLDDIRRTAQDLPADWNRNGLEANRKMIGDFASELFAQGIIAQRLTPEALFPTLNYGEA